MALRVEWALSAASTGEGFAMWAVSGLSPRRFNGGGRPLWCPLRRFNGGGIHRQRRRVPAPVHLAALTGVFVVFRYVVDKVTPRRFNGGGPCNGCCSWLGSSPL